MKLREGLATLAMGLGLCGGLAAQVAVDEAVVRATIVKQVDPVYPARAKESHLTGSVLVQVKIGANGKVESAQAVSGALVLRTAAVDAVKQWEFSPKQVDGLATSVSTMLTISFPPRKAAAQRIPAESAPSVAAPAAAVSSPESRPGKPEPAKPAEGVSKPDEAVIETTSEAAPTPKAPADAEIAKVYFALAETCHTVVAARGNTAEQAAACKAEADQADQFAPNSRYIERRSAYVYYATALMRNKQFAEAERYGTKAVAVIKQGHDDDSGSSAAFAVKGQAEALAGELESANADLEQAEIFQQAALETPGGKQMSASYKQSLKGIMTLRSQVLGAMGKDVESDKLAARADKL